VAVEFATPSVTSANFDENVSAAVALAVQNQINVPILAGGGTFNLGNPNPHLKFVDLINHGYFVLDVTEAKVQADYFYTPILTEEDNNDFAGGPFSQDGNNHLELSDAPAPAKAIQDTPAPANPPPFITANSPVTNPSLRVLAIFPNPARARVNLNFSLLKAGRLSIDLVDSRGRKLISSYSGKTPAGLFSLEQELTDLPAGQYFFRISLEGELPILQPVTLQ
jgi:alkaline phosphatase D